MNKKSILSILLILIFGCSVWWFTSRNNTQEPAQETVSASPSVSASPTATPKLIPAPISITSPKYNELVDGVITVTGRARIFENQFSVQLKDTAGNVLYRQDAVMSDAKEAGVFGNYSVKIPVPLSDSSVVNVNPIYKIEVFSYSPKGDGSFEGYASVQVKLKSLDISRVYVAYTVGDDCEKVALYPREVVKSSQIIYMTLIELLKGPNSIDLGLGATNNIPAGVRINSYRQIGNTAYVDFDQTLQQGVAGSCRVLAIRSQITNTLKQFLGISNVVISIDGKTEGILQP